MNKDRIMELANLVLDGKKRFVGRNIVILETEPGKVVHWTLEEWFQDYCDHLSETMSPKQWEAFRDIVTSKVSY